MGFNSGFKGLNGGLSCYQLRKYYFAGGWRRLGTQSNVVDTVNWKISLAELRINSLETTTCFHETRSNCKYLRSKCVNPCNDRKETKIKDSVEITNKMQPCIRIYYSTVHWRLSMFRAAYGSSSGALTVSAASGLHTHVVTGRSQVWVGTDFPLRLDYGRSPHAYVNQRLQIQLELLMMSGMPLETEFPPRLVYGRSPHAYVNQRLQIHLELLMMSGMPLETEFTLRLDYGRSPHAYVNQRLQIQLELLMMSGMLLETEFPLRIVYGRSPHGYVNQRPQIQLELLMMSGMPLETCWAFNERWNNKFCYKVASCWLFLLSHTAMHGSTNIKYKK